MMARLGNAPALLLGWMRGADTWVDHADGETLNQVPHPALVNLIPSTALAGLAQCPPSPDRLGGRPSIASLCEKRSACDGSAGFIWNRTHGVWNHLQPRHE